MLLLALGIQRSMSCYGVATGRLHGSKVESSRASSVEGGGCVTPGTRVAGNGLGVEPGPFILATLLAKKICRPGNW
jgi:hypothetical protein